MDFQKEKLWWFFRKRINKLLMNVLKSVSLFLFAALVLCAPSRSLSGDTRERPDLMNGDLTLTCAHCWTHSHSCHLKPQVISSFLQETGWQGFLWMHTKTESGEPSVSFALFFVRVLPSEQAQFILLILLSPE